MRQQKIASGTSEEVSPYPSLEEIEKTHILFTNINFRPFAKICFDYLKVPKTGVSFNSQISFEIPQYGDFFSDMVLNVVIDSATAGVTGTPTSPSADVALWRYCDRPGEKLLVNTTFSVASSTLDSYDRVVYPLTRQTTLPAHKKAGWDRCMGQSADTEAFYGYADATGTAPQNAVAKFNLSAGYQTYKQTQPALNLFIPMLFWFNEPRQAIPGLAIPFGARNITTTLAPQSDLCRAIVNPGASTSATLTNPFVPALNISVCDLYIQNMFVCDEIQEIYSNRVGFSLIRVHLTQNITLNASSGQQVLNSMKWPVTQLTIVFQPTVNTLSNPNVTTKQSQVSVMDPAMEDWNKFGLVSTQENASGTVNGVAAKYVTKKVEDHMVSIGISAFGNEIYKPMPSQFFNCYTTFKYGADTVTPSDPGVFFIPFCLFPNNYQPSGHLNVSKLREFYLNYQSNYITSSNTVTCICVGQALNFLMITRGSAGLRFVT